MKLRLPGGTIRYRLNRSLHHFINLNKRKPSDKLENDSKKNSKVSSFKRILSQVEPVKYRLGGAFVLSTFSSGIMMTIPYFTGWVIDHAVAGTIPIDQITSAGALLFGIQFGSNFFRQYLTNTSGNIVIRSLREKTFKRIMSKEISYFDGNQSGEIVSRLSSDCQIIGNSATVNLNEGFRSILQFCIGKVTSL